MSENEKQVVAINMEAELKKSYLDYAMSVIVGRALPDVRDGLKPVHRRVLYAMYELKNDWNKPYKKSARIVGDVIGKYHPHGDTAVYDAAVRAAQPFSMRYPLIDGQGNFGSVDGDAPAAMRYTEVRLSRLAHALLADLDKDTVDFVPNYDETEFAPVVMPTRVPNLLVNGSSGIAVGMATNIPPHNLGEVVQACLAMLENPNITVAELLHYIPGPDLPTAGIINGRSGIVSAYKTGRGKILMRARAAVEQSKETGKPRIIVTELPYQVNKARLLEKMGELVREKKVEGITAIRDESDKSGMRVVIELRRDENAEVLLNKLYSLTQLQCVFGINMVALTDNGRPCVMNLKQILDAFLRHRREVVTRRTLYFLRKAQQRAHLLEGLGVALVNIDDVIALIKSAANPAEAKARLLSKAWPAGMMSALLARSSQYIAHLSHARDLTGSAVENEEEGLSEGLSDDGSTYQLSAAQAQSILDLKLHRLTGLEKEKIFDEYKSLLERIKALIDILIDADKLVALIREELEELNAQFGDARRTEIIDAESFTEMDLISNDTVVVTLSQQGYIKSQLLDIYQTQHRGGRGKTGTRTKEEDFVRYLLVADKHDTVLCFSSLGRVYWLKAYQIPEASRQAAGKPIVNLLPLSADEKINAILSLKGAKPDHFLVMVTQKGYVKKVPLSQFSRPRSTGIIAIDLVPGDRLIAVDRTNGERDLLLFSDAGKAIRFNEGDIRAMGRTARGVRGIRLKDEQNVIALIVIRSKNPVLVATENGYGKRTELAAFRCIGRGGQGVMAMPLSERNGRIVAAEQVNDSDDILLVTDAGVLVRIPIGEISVIGRQAQGLRLMNLGHEEQLIALQKVQSGEDLVQAQEEESVAQEKEGEK